MPFSLDVMLKAMQQSINKIHEQCLRISRKDQKTRYQNLLETRNELTIHQRNLQVLMTEINRTV